MFRTPYSALTYTKCAFCIEIFSKQQITADYQYFISSIYQLLNTQMIKDVQLRAA